MPNKTKASIEILPVEIIHRIFDNLDAETIVLSVRQVCRLFRSVVYTYNRYIWNFVLMKKSTFVLLCRLINPENVISLTLSDDQQTPNQIALFLTTVAPAKLTRLRSLTLLNINECQLYIILKHIELTNLTLFSLNIKEDNNSSIETTTIIISSLIEQPNIRKVEFSLDDKVLSKLSWPINCTIQNLTINNSLDMNNLCSLLQYCPYMHTLIVKLVYGYAFDKTILKSFQQLQSLTIEKFNGTIEELEAFLLSTPSLVCLKLIDGKQMLDGKRWEEFIQIHLPYLHKFEFFFKQYDVIGRTDADMKLIIDSFRSPFWIEHKKWFIICEYGINGSHICLYSVPICKSHLEYDPEYKTNSISTYNMIVPDDRLLMNNVKSLKLNLNKLLADHIEEKKKTRKVPVFPKVIEIYVEIDNGWPSSSMQLFSILIDYSKIVQLIWHADCCERQKEQSLIDLNVFLKQASSLSFLFIQNYPYEFFETINDLCLIIPSHVKHLQMPVKSLKHITTIMKRCENLSTVQFDIKSSKFSEELIEWFVNNTINSTCSSIPEEVNVWIGKKFIQPTKVTLHNKSCIIS